MENSYEKLYPSPYQELKYKPVFGIFLKKTIYSVCQPTKKKEVRSIAFSLQT